MSAVGDDTASCTCPCIRCRWRLVIDEGPLAVVSAYSWGACSCGEPGEDEFYDGEEFWLTCERCKTRWYSGNETSDDAAERKDGAWEPWKLQTYREISGKAPAWAKEAFVAHHAAMFHLIKVATGTPPVLALCPNDDHHVSEDEP